MIFLGLPCCGKSTFCKIYSYFKDVYYLDLDNYINFLYAINTEKFFIINNNRLFRLIESSLIFLIEFLMYALSGGYIFIYSNILYLIIIFNFFIFIKNINHIFNRKLINFYCGKKLYLERNIYYIFFRFIYYR